MYSVCLYCKTNLGRNEVVEAFPVGWRLAFDAARGRLWVVCTRCGRWNLSPLEERWEAIEQCERHFRDTRQRVTTENIGLARVAAGMELVRVGKPLRPELAAWRYGGELLRRRRRHRVEQYLSHGLGVSLWAGVVPFAWPLLLPWIAYDIHRNRQVVARIPGDGETAIEVSRKQVRASRLLPDEDGDGWMLRVAHGGGTADRSGSEALRMAALVLPHINRKGAASAQVNTAVSELERAGGVDALFRSAAVQLKRDRYVGLTAYDHRIEKAPPELRLALEMASHEEAERRALEGELHLLEQAWKEAEEIAAIADRLLIPDSVNRLLETLRRRGNTPADPDAPLPAEERRRR